MKKNIFAFALILALLLSLSSAVFADHLKGSDNWTVTFTTAGKINSNFTTGAIQDAVSTLQPGDDITISIKLKNQYKDPVNWYMMNTIIKSLEDGTSAAGGAYSYVLTYTAATGKTTELYNSDHVGGELGSSKAPEGLHSVDEALKEYFFLEAMPRGDQGEVTLTVALDGETQGNSYQNTLADLRMRFAAELSTGKTVVKTGDETKLTPYYAAMVVSGVVFLALAIDGLLQKRRNRRKSA